MSADRVEQAGGLPELSETGRLELDILTLLQTPAAVEAFISIARSVTEATAPQFAGLLRLINEITVPGEAFVDSVSTAMLAAVHTPTDIDRLAEYGALSTGDPFVRLAAVQLLHTLHAHE